MKDFFDKHYKKLFLIGVFILAVEACVLSVNKYLERRERDKIAEYPFTVMKHEAVLSYNEYKSRLVKEVKHYIDSVARPAR